MSTQAEKQSWRAQMDTEMDAVDGKIRRLLRSRDAEIANLKSELRQARTDRARARAMMDELGSGLNDLKMREGRAFRDCVDG